MGLLDFLRRARSGGPGDPGAVSQPGETPAQERADERERDRLDPTPARVDADAIAGGEPERDRPPRRQ